MNDSSFQEIEGMKKIFLGLRDDFNSWRSETALFSRRNLVLLFISVLVVLLGFSALFRADIDYVDDLGRNLSGWGEWGFNFFRWILFLENYLIQFNIGLADASPLVQYIAAVIMASSSFLLAFVISSNWFGKKQIPLIAFIASFTLAFNPYFLECMSYKYDSVGMATSVFVSIVPFLFINKKYLYFVISLLSVFVMCTSYQASSGIYIMLVIFSGLISYLTDNDVTLKNIFSFFASSAIAYLVATVFFYILSTLFGAPYRDTSLVLNPILWINNFIALIRIVKFDFNIVWAVLTILVIVLSAITLVSRSKRNKVLAAILTAIAISVALFLSIGAYIFLTDGVESARMIYGVGVFIAILSVIATFNIFKTSLLAVPAILLSWVLFVYSFIYANALAAQEDYGEMHEALIINDLVENLDSAQQYELLIDGFLEWSPAVDNVSRWYPITNRLVVNYYNGPWYWSGYRLARYYLLNLDKAPESLVYDFSSAELIEKNSYYEIFLNSSNCVLIRFLF